MRRITLHGGFVFFACIVAIVSVWRGALAEDFYTSELSEISESCSPHALLQGRISIASSMQIPSLFQALGCKTLVNVGDQKIQLPEVVGGLKIIDLLTILANQLPDAVWYMTNGKVVFSVKIELEKVSGVKSFRTRKELDHALAAAGLFGNAWELLVKKNGRIEIKTVRELSEYFPRHNPSRRITVEYGG